MGNILRTRFNTVYNDEEILGAAPNQQVVIQEIKKGLAACNHAMRCSVSKSLLNNTPGEVVFGRDMLLNIPVIIDLQVIQDGRQLQINKNLRRQNSKRREFDFQVNGEVLIKIPNHTKLSKIFQGPFTITQIFTNGTVEL